MMTMMTMMTIRMVFHLLAAARSIVTGFHRGSRSGSPIFHFHIWLFNWYLEPVWFVQFPAPFCWVWPAHILLELLNDRKSRETFSGEKKLRIWRLGGQSFPCNAWNKSYNGWVAKNKYWPLQRKHRRGMMNRSWTELTGRPPIKIVLLQTFVNIFLTFCPPP